MLSYSLGETEAGDPPRRRRPVLECRTLRPVALGDELTHNFIDLAAPTVERQTKLAHAYHFDCDCTRCAAVAPEAKFADANFRAPHPEYSRPAQAKGRNRMLTQAAKLLAQAEHCAGGDGSVEQEGELVQTALVLRKTVSHNLSLDVYEANSAAYKVALASGQLEAALTYMVDMVRFLRMAYFHIPEHPMLCIQRTFRTFTCVFLATSPVRK